MFLQLHIQSIINKKYHVYVLQGNISPTWLDNQLVSYTTWYDPRVYEQMSPRNVTIHYVTSGKRISIKNTFPITEQIKQPDMSVLKQCVIGYSNYVEILWFTESCTKQFHATYVCRTHSQRSQYEAHRNQLSPYPGYHCDKGWFLLTNSSTCYIILQSQPNFNFYTAIKACSFLNSSILTVNTVKFVPRLEEKQIKALQDLTARTKKLYRIPSSLLVNTLIGYGVKHDAQSQPLIMMRTIFDHYSFPAALNSKYCGMVRYESFYSNLMNTEDSNVMIGWSAQNYRCKQRLKSTGIVCEKPSQLSSSTKTCSSQYYECNDGTCILLMYQCDLWEDCLSGDDESNCSSSSVAGDQFILINDTLYLSSYIFSVTLVPRGFVNSSLFQPFLKIHSFCDGIESDSLMVAEDKVCFQRPVKHINTRDMVVATTNLIPESSVFRVVQQLDRLAESRKNVDTGNVTFLAQVQIKCQNKRFKTISDMCHVNAHNEQCAFEQISPLCMHIACPGMFRCTYHYCLRMSVICDGHIDCVNGDDEQFCSNTSCPGFLKCRGEIRCLSIEQICDGYVDCMSSFDDEIGCKRCPSNCRCDGYIIHCNIFYLIRYKSDIEKLYVKGIVVNGIQDVVNLKVFSTSSIIYVNMSHCGVEMVVFSEKSHSIKQFILFIDFSHNKFIDTSFLVVDILKKLLVLDLGYNKISMVSNKHFRLQFLAFLDLTCNSLQTVSLNLKINLQSLILLNLKNVNFTMKIWITPKQDNLVVVMASDYKFCCILPQHVKCGHDSMMRKCYGIMNSSLSATVFACLMLLTAISLIISTIKVLNDINSNTKLHYNIFKMNHIVAECISSFSLISLSAIGITTINIVKWRQSIGCYLINFMFSLSLGSTMIFKTCSMSIVALKLACPFGHRFLKVRNITFLSSISWFIMPCFYVISTTVVHFQNNSLFLDKYCSIGDCDLDVMDRQMIIFVCAVDILAILTFFILLSLVMFTLRKNDKHINNTIPSLKVAFHFGRQLSSQIILTVHLCLISIVNIFLNYSATDYCFAVSTFVLPSCILLGSILNMLM